MAPPCASPEVGFLISSRSDSSLTVTLSLPETLLVLLCQIGVMPITSKLQNASDENR